MLLSCKFKVNKHKKERVILLRNPKFSRKVFIFKLNINIGKF